MLLVKIDRETKKLIVVRNDKTPKDILLLKKYREAKLLK